MFSYDTRIVLFYFLFLIGVLIIPTFLIKFCKPELSSGNECNISGTFGGIAQKSFGRNELSQINSLKKVFQNLQDVVLAKVILYI